MTKLKISIDELLVRGCDDDIQAAEVVSVAVSYGEIKNHENNELRKFSLEIIKNILEERLMEIGDDRY